MERDLWRHSPSLQLQGRDPARISSPGGSVFALAAHPTTDNLVTANGDNALRLFNLNGDLIRELLPANDRNGGIRSVAFSKQGQLLTASPNGGATLWVDPANPLGHVLSLYRSQNANCVQFNPEGTKIAVTSGRQLRIYSDQRHLLATAQCPTLITSLSFSQSGRYLAMGTRGGEIFIFDLQAANGAGEIVFSLQEHEGAVSAIAFSHFPEFTLHSADTSGRLISWGITKNYPNHV